MPELQETVSKVREAIRDNPGMVTISAAFVQDMIDENSYLNQVVGEETALIISDMTEEIVSRGKEIKRLQEECKMLRACIKLGVRGDA